MTFIEKKCENCDNILKLKIVEKGKNVGNICLNQKKRFCSVKCQTDWQRKTKWEDRIGIDKAEKIRKETSERVSGDKNPTHNPEVAKKVSDSLKIYLKENPRNGEKNSFYGKKHSKEYIKWAIESRKGKWSYNEEQKKKQEENSPKGENCHLWNGGHSYDIYPKEFNNKLKKKIKNRDNHICCICNKKTQKLIVHHIDYNKMNSNEKNLISLCCSCHGKTNINRNRWQVFFESIINEKYKITDILTVEKTLV